MYRHFTDSLVKAARASPELLDRYDRQRDEEALGRIADSTRGDAYPKALLGGAVAGGSIPLAYDLAPYLVWGKAARARALGRVTTGDALEGLLTGSDLPPGEVSAVAQKLRASGLIPAGDPKNVDTLNAIRRNWRVNQGFPDHLLDEGLDTRGNTIREFRALLREGAERAPKKSPAWLRATGQVSHHAAMTALPFALIGAALAASGVRKKRKQAKKLGVSR